VFQLRRAREIYGLGVQIRQTEFGETYGHGGWFPGYLSEIIDPLTFVAIPVMLVLVALLASYIPAQRATRVDPTVSLRSE
jgi:ABC-type lipoprotein release transport system permease subunit